MTPRAPSPTRSVPPALLALALVLSLPPSHASAQALDAAAGTVVGAAGGAVVSMALVAGSARSGRYLFSPDPLRWEALPIPLGAVTGAVAGHGNPDRFWRSAGWGAGGLVLGSLAGAAAGRLGWGTSEGAWTGALLGAAAGILAGTLAGALTWEGDGPTPALLRLRIPTGP